MPDKMPCIIYVANPEKSSTTKIDEHIPCGYSMSTIWAFCSTKNNHSLYHGDDCMKIFCISLEVTSATKLFFATK